MSASVLHAHHALATSVDGRFVVVRSRPELAEQLAGVQGASFPSLAPEELMNAGHYRQQMATFPEGQLAVWDTQENRVAGGSTDLRLNVDFGHYQHRYIEAVGGNTLSTHQPDGQWLYGADIGVLPDYRGFGLSTLLYRARHELVRELRLCGHVAGAMPKGYAAHQHQLPIEAYVHEVIAGRLSDPVLSVVFRRGYRVYGLIPEYLDDPSCANYGVFVVWRNPDRGWA